MKPIRQKELRARQASNNRLSDLGCSADGTVLALFRRQEIVYVKTNLPIEIEGAVKWKKNIRSDRIHYTSDSGQGHYPMIEMLCQC